VDLLDIIILAAAGVGLVAFVVLAVIILRQGRSIRTLEDRIGPPVPPAAAPSLERVRAVSAQSGPAVVVAAASAPATAPEPAVAEEPAEAPEPVAVDAPEPAADAPAETAGEDAADARAQTAREAQAARQAQKAEKKAQKDQAREQKKRDRAAAGDDVPSGRGLQLGAIIIVVVGLLGAGGWYFLVRDDGSSSSTTAASTTPTTSTSPDAGGKVPEDVPPLANKAAYTVAVLNASNITGAAANKVAPRVQADGYTLGVVDNASKQGIKVSQVQYVKGRQEVGWNLAKDLDITTAVPVDALAQGRIGTADAVVIVGTDLAK
jgi:hypothetical protein